MRKLLRGILVTAATLLLLTCLAGLFAPARQSGTRDVCFSNMRRVSLALKNYADEHGGQLPPAYVADVNGRPMHSWRVLILPYLGEKEQALFDRYNFDEPWNGPDNSRLAESIPEIYQCPPDLGHRNEPRPWTRVAVVVGSHTLWPGAESGSLVEIPDGANDTLLLVEVANSGIHWTEPRDLQIDTMSMHINPSVGQGISSRDPRTARVMFADGHGVLLSDQLTPGILRQLLTIDDGGPEPSEY
jgi:hypothetical protein